MSQPNSGNLYDAGDQRHLDGLVQMLAASGKSSTIRITKKIDFTTPHLTIPKNVSLRFENGGGILFSNNQNIEFQGLLQAGLFQIFFDLDQADRILIGGAGPVLPQWFGAKGDGKSDDTEAIRHALNALDSNPTSMRIPAGRYRVSEPLEIPANVNVYGDGVSQTIVSAVSCNNPKFRYPNQAVFNFKGHGILNVGKLTAPAYEHDSVIKVSLEKNATIEPGDTLVIHDGRDSSFSKARDYYNAGEFLHVAGPQHDKTTIRIYGALQDSYDAIDSVRLWKLREPTSSSIHDMTILGDNSEEVAPLCLRFHLGRNVSVYNVNLDGAAYRCLELDRCFGAFVHDVTAEQNTEVPIIKNGEEHEIRSASAVGIVNSQDVIVQQCKLSGIRHSIALGSYSFDGGLPNPVNRDVLVTHCVLRNRGHLPVPGKANEAVSSADAHGNADRCVYSDNRIYGGISIGGKRMRVVNNDIFGIAGDTSKLRAQPSVGIYPGELLSTEFEVANNNIICPATYHTEQDGVVGVKVRPYTRSEGVSRIVNNRITIQRRPGDAGPVAAIMVGDIFDGATPVGFSGWNVHVEGNDIDAGAGVGVKFDKKNYDAVDALWIVRNRFRNFSEAIDHHSDVEPVGSVMVNEFGTQPNSGIDKAGNIFE